MSVSPASVPHRMGVALVDDLMPRASLHGVQLGEQGPEQLQLVRIADGAVGLLRLDLGQQKIDRLGLAGDLTEPLEPGLQLGIRVAQTIDRLLELDVTPDSELVVVLVRAGLFEMVERRLGFTPVVQHVGQINPGLRKFRLELERPAQPEERAAVASQPVISIAEAGGSVRRLLMRRHRELEESLRWPDQRFAEERPPDLQHQLVILLESQQDDPLEGPQRTPALP